MRNAVLACLLLLCACKKDDRSIEYRINTRACWVEYVNRDEKWVSQDVRGVPILDSTLVDTVYHVFVKGYEPTTWSMGFDAPADFSPHMNVQVDGDTADAFIKINGGVTSHKTCVSYHAPVSMP
jgi:hypothetical protein